MSWLFRFTFHHFSTGFFQFASESTSYCLPCGIEITLTARDAETLCNASRFHIDGRPFSDAEMARATGEKLRRRLQLLNIMLGLGMSIPTADERTGGVSEPIKEKFEQDYNGIIVDNVSGLAVHPDDGRHYEIVTSAKLTAAPERPDFIFTEIEKLWQIECELDDNAADALNILSAAVTESSDRTKFLLTYFAAEQVISRPERNEKTKSIVEDIKKSLELYELDEAEKNSLKSVIGGLKYTSFKDALSRIADSIDDPPEYCGLKLKEFLVLCARTRDKLAHSARVIQFSEAASELRVTRVWPSAHPRQTSL